MPRCHGGSGPIRWAAASHGQRHVEVGTGVQTCGAIRKANASLSTLKAGLDATVLFRLPPTAVAGCLRFLSGPAMLERKYIYYLCSKQCSAWDVQPSALESARSPVPGPFGTGRPSEQFRRAIRHRKSTFRRAQTGYLSRYPSFSRIRQSLRKADAARKADFHTSPSRQRVLPRGHVHPKWIQLQEPCWLLVLDGFPSAQRRHVATAI